MSGQAIETARDILAPFCVCAFHDWSGGAGRLALSSEVLLSLMGA